MEVGGDTILHQRNRTDCTEPDTVDVRIRCVVVVEVVVDRRSHRSQSSLHEEVHGHVHVGHELPLGVQDEEVGRRSDPG
jgi:hypothetical protein